MVKFTRVLDPERVRDGDLLVFPAGAAKLNLKPSTFGDLGLSMGRTGRSDNSPETVAAWLSRPDAAARLFMVCDVSHKSAPRGDDLLLTMDACLERKIPEVPRVSTACLVPFGPKLWTWKRWAACWNETHGGAVTKELAALAGAGCALADTVGVEDDQYMNQVWNEDNDLNGLSGDPAGGETAEDWFPVRSGRDKVDPESFDVATLMAWDGKYGPKSGRIQFNAGFLSNLARRGARVLRPDGEFERLVTASVVSWYCHEMQARFLRRVSSGRAYLRGLAADIRRDAGRARRYDAISRKLGRLGPRLSKETLKGTGATA